MPHNDGEVRVEITGDSSKIKKELKETEAAVKNTANSISEMTDALEDTSKTSNSFENITENAKEAAKAVSNVSTAAESFENIAENADSAAKSISKAANETDSLGDSMKNEAKAAEKALEALKEIEKAFDVLSAPLDNIKNKLSLKPAFDEIKTSVNTIIHPIETFKAKLSKASTALETKRNKLAVLRSEYDSTKQKVADLTAEFNKSAKENGATAKETQELAQKLKDAEQAAATTKGELEDYAESVKKTGDKSKEASEQSSKFADALKSGFGAAAKIGAAAIGAAATGISAIAKSAVENFAEYEQLVGGVETLFKSSADIVQGYAANAYKTAGLSANQYMETVTSFSASLLQSLGGNTEAAAAVADKAIIDMADNANKMGTDMQSIQNAYQGFAKQNYTMLDNLKLGFGGTKEEMQRLLDTANEYNRQQGKNTDYQIESFADIVEAIHVVQTEMHISGISAEEAAQMVASGAMTQEEAFEAMGTTAKEAATTIQGSLFSVKAAWQNLVTGIADENADFGTLISNFVESATTALGNLLPRVKTSLEGIGELVTELSPVIAETIPELVDDVLPSILQAAVDLVTALVNALVDNGGTVADTALDILDMLVNALVDNADNITDGAVALITTLVNGISERLPDLIPAALQIVLEVVKGILDNSGALVSAALQLIISLGAGLLEALPQLVEAVVMIPTSIADSIVNYDWGSVAESVINSLANSFDKLGKEFQIWLDNTFSGGTVYGGDIANVDSIGLVKNMRENSKLVGDEIRKAQENYQKYYNEGKEILGMGQQDISDALENSTKAFKEQSEKNSAAINDVINKSNNAAAAAISTGGDKIAEATKKSGEKQKSVLVQNMEALERLYKQRQITEEEYQRRRLEYLEAHRDEDSDEWTKYYDSVQTYYEKVAKTEQQAAETAAKEVQQSVEKSVSSIVKQWQKSYDELEKKRENYKKKLLSIGGDIFSVDETEKPDGTKVKQYTVKNLDEQIKAMRKYNADIAKLKKQGASSALLEELTSFNDSDSQEFAKHLAGMSAEEFKKINEAYAEKQRIADELSKELYADEYSAIADGINTALDEVSAGAADKGKEAAESYAKAFGDTLLKHSEDFYPLLGDEKHMKWFGNSGDTPNLFSGMSGDMEKLICKTTNYKNRN